jgi:outer membrane protein, heavy metal efflux system
MRRENLSPLPATAGNGAATGAPDNATAPMPAGMTLADLEQIALANNPTLVQASARVRALRGTCLQVGLYPNPTLAYQGDEIGNEGKAGFQGARVGQEIVTGGKLGLRRTVAAHEVEQAEHALEAQHQRVRNDVRSDAYDVLFAQRAVELNQQLLLIAQEGLKTAEGLLVAKEVSRIDVLQARIEVDTAGLQLVNAQNRYRAAWQRLAAVLGTPAMQPVPLLANLEEMSVELNWDDAWARLLQQSPELSEARVGVQRARCAVAQQCAERVPNVGVQAGVQYDTLSQFTIASAEVGVALPIFNRNQGNIYRAEAEQIAAEHEVRRIELVLQDRLAAVFEQYANAREEVGRYAADILPNAKTSLELVRAGYRQGQLDYLTLLTAQRTYFRVNLTYLESLRQYRTSSVAIEGLLLSGGLRDGKATPSQAGSD